MNKVILDQSALTKLNELNEGAEICDETGRVVGFFMPAVDRSLYEGVDSPVSTEELSRRSKQGGGRSLPEILADLEKRA